MSSLPPILLSKPLSLQMEYWNIYKIPIKSSIKRPIPVLMLLYVDESYGTNGKRNSLSGQNHCLWTLDGRFVWKECNFFGNRYICHGYIHAFIGNKWKREIGNNEIDHEPTERQWSASGTALSSILNVDRVRLSNGAETSFRKFWSEEKFIWNYCRWPFATWFT